MINGNSSSLTRCLKRLQKEKEDISNNHEFELEIISERKWTVSFKGANGSLYENEKFKLQFKFGENYVRKYIFLII